MTRKNSLESDVQILFVCHLESNIAHFISFHVTKSVLHCIIENILVGHAEIYTTFILNLGAALVLTTLLTILLFHALKMLLLITQLVGSGGGLCPYIAGHMPNKTNTTNCAISFTIKVR